MRHRVALVEIECKIRILQIAGEQTLTFQIPTDPMTQLMRQCNQLGMARCFHAKELRNTMPIFCIHAIEKQHVEMDVQIECGAKPLDQ